MALTRFHSAPGTVYMIKNPWNLPKKYETKLADGSEMITRDSDAGKIITTGYTMRENEITSKTSCIDDNRVMFSFGKGFGDIVIQFEALLGANTSDNALTQKFNKALAEVYEANRLNKAAGQTNKFSIAGSHAVEFHLVGYNIGGYIPEIEVLPFSLIGVLAK